MKLRIPLLLATLIPAAAILARADETADYAFLTARLPNSLPASGVPGSLALFGYHTFPLIVQTESIKDETSQWAVAAAGFCDDSPSAARAVAFAHTCWAEPKQGQGPLLENALRWAGRKEQPVVGLGPGLGCKTYLQQHGWAVKELSPQLTPENDLTGIDVVAVDVQRIAAPQAFRQLTQFTAQGGGLLLFAAVALLSGEQQQAANDVLRPFGLALSREGQPCDSYLVSPAAYSPYFSAARALEALLDDHAMLRRMAPASKPLAADAISRTLAAGVQAEPFHGALERLNANYGWIQVSAKKPLRVAEQPVEAMLARYQAMKLDTLPAAKLPAHPSAADWPGRVPLCAAVTKTITIVGNAPPNVLINHGEQGLWVPTGLYARPGEVVKVSIPADKTAAGLVVLVGVHVDENFHHEIWTRYPKVVRRDPLNQPVTETGCAFGGLVTIVVPAGAQLGPFPVTIQGAVEAPYFQYGITSNEEWNRRLRDLPGAWGVLESPSMTLYVARQHLQTLSDPNAVMAHWTRVIATADRYMGYQGRKRGEAALCDRQIVAGFGHDGYPVMMAYGDSSALVKEAVEFGDWGFYHELGHTYQHDFAFNYTIATTPEVDVNLVPGLLMTLLHQRLPGDNNTYDTFDAGDRLRQREKFLRLPREEQTWKNACEMPDRLAGPDFYFNLAEAFGWELYGRALGRIFRFCQNPANDAEINALDRRDPNYLRNRFFLVFSQESGRNLAPYFERYGLGRAPYGLSPAVKERVAKLPAWTHNRPVASLSNPGKLTVVENTAQGTALCTFTATDPDPVTVFRYEIVAGNEDGAFSIDRTGGVLRVMDVDYERRHDYQLTVEVRDNTVPSSAVSQVVPIEVLNVPEPPKLATIAYTAQNWVPPGTILGPVGVAVESGRTIQSLTLQAGNEQHAFDIDSAARLILVRPTTLPSLGLQSLKVQVVDSAGQTDVNWLYVVCGRPTGVNEEVWKDNALNRPPKKRGLCSDFQAPCEGDGTVCHLTGFVVPPRTGLYTFWICSADEGFLYLSTDVSAGNKREIAKLLTRAKPQQWERSPQQKSAPILLEAGRLYYIEALEHARDDEKHRGESHVEVAWQGPGMPRQIIPTWALIPATAMRAGP
jgi:hypothetical protein